MRLIYITLRWLASIIDSDGQNNNRVSRYIDWGVFDATAQNTNSLSVETASARQVENTSFKQQLVCMILCERTTCQHCGPVDTRVMCQRWLSVEWENIVTHRYGSADSSSSDTAKITLWTELGVRALYDYISKLI